MKTANCKALLFKALTLRSKLVMLYEFLLEQCVWFFCKWNILKKRLDIAGRIPFLFPNLLCVMSVQLTCWSSSVKSGDVTHLVSIINFISNFI